MAGTTGSTGAQGATGATGLDGSADAEGDARAHLRRWGRRWVVLAWTVPLLALGLRLVTPMAGWETLILVLLAPLWVPGLAVLGLVPRWIWRSRAGKDAELPTPLLALMAAHWGALVLVAFSMPAVGDSGASDSLLLVWFPRLDQRAETLAFSAAVLCAVAALLAAIVFASAARTSRGRRAPGGAGQRATLLAAGIALPVLIVGVAAGVQLAAMDGARDPAGRTELDASRLGFAETVAAHEAAWEEVQERAAPLRAAVAAEHWGAGRTSGATRVDTRAREFRVSADWRIRVADPLEVTLDRVRAALAEEGWTADRAAAEDRGGIGADVCDAAVRVACELRRPADQGEGTVVSAWAEHDTGARVAVRVSDESPGGPATVTVFVDGPVYWGGLVDWWDREQLEDPALDGVPTPPNGYAADEWPELGPFERERVSLDESFEPPAWPDPFSEGEAPARVG